MNVLEYNTKQAQGCTKIQNHVKVHIRKFLGRWAGMYSIPPFKGASRLQVQRYRGFCDTHLTMNESLSYMTLNGVKALNWLVDICKEVIMNKPQT